MKIFSSSHIKKAVSETRNPKKYTTAGLQNTSIEESSELSDDHEDRLNHRNSYGNRSNHSRRNPARSLGDCIPTSLHFRQEFGFEAFELAPCSEKIAAIQRYTSTEIPASNFSRVRRNILVIYNQNT